MRLIAPITEINEKDRQIKGILALEVLDKSGEIMDYNRSKPNFLSWSQELQMASQGKSVGNLRSMHKNVAAGRFIELNFNDALRQIEFVAEVDDDNEWKKCRKGTYTGISIGGDKKAWRDKEGRVRYEARPVEGSLVDNPMQYGAYYTIINEQGVSKLAKFAAEEIKPQDEEDVRQVWTCKSKHLHMEKAAAQGCMGADLDFDNFPTYSVQNTEEKAMPEPQTPPQTPPQEPPAPQTPPPAPQTPPPAPVPEGPSKEDFQKLEKTVTDILNQNKEVIEVQNGMLAFLTGRKGKMKTTPLSKSADGNKGEEEDEVSKLVKSVTDKITEYDSQLSKSDLHPEDRQRISSLKAGALLKMNRIKSLVVDEDDE